MVVVAVVVVFLAASVPVDAFPPFSFFLPKPFLLWLVCRHQLVLDFFCCDSYVCSFCGVVDVAVVVAMVVAVVIAVVACVLVVVVVPVAS